MERRRQQMDYEHWCDIEWEHWGNLFEKGVQKTMPTGEEIRVIKWCDEFNIGIDDLSLYHAVSKQDMDREAYKFYIRERMRKHIINQRKKIADYYSLEEHYWIYEEWLISKNGNFTKKIDGRYYAIKQKDNYFEALFSGVDLKPENRFFSFDEANEASFLDYLKRVSTKQLKPNFKWIK